MSAKVLLRVTGHSMGGSLAMFCAQDFAVRFGWDARCVTFGAPRLGDIEYCRTFNADVPCMARFINKMDPVPRLPTNPDDPHDDGALLTGLLSTAFALPQKALTSDGDGMYYHHNCRSVQLDPGTSDSLHLLLGAMEAATLVRAGSPGNVAEHFILPHLCKSYAESLHQAIEEQERKKKRQQWCHRASVGTWLHPRIQIQASSSEAKLPEFDPKVMLDSFSSEAKTLLEYGSALLEDFQGQGPCVLLDLSSKAAAYTTQQLIALGVEDAESSKVSLEKVLKVSPQLLTTEQGRLLLRSAQERLLSMLPILAVTTAGSLSENSLQVHRQLEQSGLATELLRWGKEQLEAAERDPELLRNCLASLDISVLCQLGSPIDALQVLELDQVKDQCMRILYSEITMESLRTVGIEFDDSGSVRLEQVLAKGKQLLETEGGREVLRNAQDQALNLLAMLQAQASGAGLSEQSEEFLAQLDATEQGRALVRWGKETLTEAQRDPESLQRVLMSVDFSTAGEWGVQCKELLASSVKVDGLVETGRKILDTEAGAGLVRSAQQKVLDLRSYLEGTVDQAGLLDMTKAYLQLLEESSQSAQSRELLEQGRLLLASAEQDPDALKKWLSSIEVSQANEWLESGSKIVANDEGSRDAFLAMVKDRCLDFLAEQLPLIRVPKIESDTDGTEYSIDNIDLSNCSIDKDHVTIELKKPCTASEEKDDTLGEHQGDEKEEARDGTGCEVLRVIAKEICVHIPDLQWHYSKKSFPYFSSDGSAETTASGACVTLVFELRSSKVNGDLIPRFVLASCNVVIDHFDLQVRESSLSWLYNTFGYLFQNAVKNYVTSSLDEAITGNISSLLMPLNRYVQPYWPLILATVELDVQSLPPFSDDEEYIVNLCLQSDEAIGADFVDEEECSLRLMDIEEEGPLHRWNESAPDACRVALYDVLLEVDGIRGDKMIEVLDSRPINEMVFRRCTESELEKFKHLTEEAHAEEALEQDGRGML
eukprot:TRINITY_DN25646_c0_g1_i1.p1 TRINITY_DN25646_c0_g1~~TRINITY_DN25646_c0_g1_i1.p1  ORF type:complete len:1162 (-),score=261.61 TRINITY_DN25646_c0_g1_i1:63-3044(-)